MHELKPEPAAQLHATGVDLSGLMTVLGRHLYSTPMVALRELVQNAHDSIVRRRLEDAAFTGPAQILVQGDRSSGTLTVTDTGAGLTVDEIHRYLATVGVGYTRTLREKSESEELIGLFGLGFLSAFVLAKRVVVLTTSFQSPDQTACYQSTNGEQYTVTPAPPRPVGTRVSLELRDEFKDLAREAQLTRVLGRYCALLKEPLYIGSLDQCINSQVPPWREEQPSGVVEHPVQVRRRQLAFAARFEPRFSPLCAMPVAPSGKSDARGLLWLQDGATYGTSDNRNLSVFVRGMLLDDDARDLLPPWAGFVGGVLESSRLTPTASREDLQRDDTYRAVQAALSEALVTGMSEVARSQPEAWRRVIARHNEALLGAALCEDRLFDLLADQVQVPTSRGDLPIRELVTRGRIHIALGEGGGAEEMLFRALRTPVARGDRYAVLPLLRQYAARRGLTTVEIGTEEGDRNVFAPAELPEEETRWLASLLSDGEVLVLARFSPLELPLVVVPDREAELKKRLESDELDRRVSTAALALVRSFAAKIERTVLRRLYVNVDNPAIAGLLGAKRSGRAGTEEPARVLKALKQLMNAADAGVDGAVLNDALRVLSEHAASLLVDRLQPPPAPHQRPQANQGEPT